MLNKLLQKIISKSFKELENKPILIKFDDVFNIHDTYCIYFSYHNHFEINVDWSLQNKKSALMGAIVHELCHIVWETNISSVHFYEDYDLYCNNPMHMQRDEIYTDLQTIMCGYGKHLLSLMKHFHNYPTKDYASGQYCGMKISDIEKLI